MRIDLQQGNSPFTNVPTLRDNYGADFVMLLVDKPTNGAICGVARAIPTYLTSDATTQSYAFAITSIDCATTDYTFTHELGHTLGVRHDYDYGTSSCVPSRACDPNTTAYTYSHGFTDRTYDFRDIMGSQNSASGTDCDLDTDGCPRLNRWSADGQTVTLGSGTHAMSDSATYTDAKRHLDGGGGNGGAVAAFVDHRVPSFSAPGQPSAISRDSGCYGTYEVYWPAASGTVGWYEMEASYSTSFTSPWLVYRGIATSQYYSAGTSGSTQYARVRACNAAGCSSWRSYVTLAPQNYCL